MSYTFNSAGRLEIASATGAAALSETITFPIGQLLRIVSVELHLSAAPTSAGSITVTHNPSGGAAYDTVLNSQSLVGVTNYVWMPTNDLYLVGDDTLSVAYINTDTRTYGLTVTLENV